MQLAAYLSKADLSATQFAKNIGVSKSLITYLIQGKRKASPAMAKKIERATAGAVKKYELRGDIWDAPKRRAA